MRRFAAILNPQADRGRTGRLAERLQSAVRGQLEIHFLHTRRRGDAVQLARDAAAEDYEAVVAIGGDGTVHEVANGLMAAPAEQRRPLGVIPAGSGNDFAFACGIAADFKEAIRTLTSGRRRAVDVGLIHAVGGPSCYMVNNLGMFLDGEVNLASHRLSWPRGSALYLRAVLQTLLRKPAVARLELSVDGVAMQRQGLVLSIGSGPRSGGRFFLVPAAAIDDGRFDYLLVGPLSRPRLLWELLQCGNLRRQPHRAIERGQFATMKISADIAIAAHVDGEPWLRPEENHRQIEISVLPGALQVLSGATAP